MEQELFMGGGGGERGYLGLIFQYLVLRPTVNWELVAWHEGNMDAVNGIFVLDHIVGRSDLLTSYRFMSCICALILEGGGVPVLILEGGGVPVLILEGGGVPALILEGGGVPALILEGGGVPALILEGGGVPALILEGGGVPALILEGGGVPALILEGGGVPALILEGGGIPALILEGGGVPVLIFEGGGVPADAGNSASSQASRQPQIFFRMPLCKISDYEILRTCCVILSIGSTLLDRFA